MCTGLGIAYAVPYIPQRPDNVAHGFTICPYAFYSSRDAIRCNVGSTVCPRAFTFARMSAIPSI